MTNATGEAKSGPLRLGFDSSVQLLFRGSAISSDGGLLLHRELDDALGLTDLATDLLVDHRTGKNGRHTFVGLLRQSIFSRLAGYEDVNDADRLCRDPVMRQLVGGRAVKRGAASASAMGRFETATLTQAENLAALADLSGHWVVTRCVVGTMSRGIVRLLSLSSYGVSEPSRECSVIATKPVLN